MFYECRKLNTLDVSNWDTSNVTDMEYMFDNCKSLEVLDVSQWNTGKVTTFDHMFASRNQNAFDMKFKELDVSNWDTSNVVELNSMFYGCGSLTKLDLSGWDVSKVTTVNHMLSDCNHLTELNLKGWDTSSLVVMDCFLNDCDALTVVDVSTFKTHNVKDFCQVFDSCEALTQIIGLENWDTSNGLIFEEMFAGCTSLKELNLSSFNTRNAMNSYKSEADTYNGFQSMFNGTNALEKLVLSDDFSFDGDGKVTNESYKAKLPAPNNAEGKWYDAEGNAYAPSEIPEEKAATYYAVKPVNP
jgi:surface protein